MNWTLELDVEVEGKAIPGDPGSWEQPPEPAHAEIDYVWLVGWEGEGKNSERKRIDITSVISEGDMEEIEEAFLEHHSFDDGPYDTLEEKRGER